MTNLTASVEAAHAAWTKESVVPVEHDLDPIMLLSSALKLLSYGHETAALQNVLMARQLERGMMKNHVANAVLAMTAKIQENAVKNFRPRTLPMAQAISATAGSTRHVTFTPDKEGSAVTRIFTFRVVSNMKGWTIEWAPGSAFRTLEVPLLLPVLRTTFVAERIGCRMEAAILLTEAIAYLLEIPCDVA